MNTLIDWFTWWVLGPSGWVLLWANVVAFTLLGIGFLVGCVQRWMARL